ncbi:cofG [Symbiodinium sp. CCMP2592]|nr:cofG [Symbiodinium sp. CCMP2592]
MLLIQRMCGEYDQNVPSMRKAWGYQVALARHQVCGAYLHFRALMEKRIPGGKWKEVQTSLDSQFQYGFLDVDLSHVLCNEVPPGSLESISACRPYLRQVEIAEDEKKSAEAEKMKKQVREASCQQLMAQIENDMAQLHGRDMNKHRAARETALDVKYIRDRQGHLFVENFMKSSCQLLRLEEDADFVKSAILNKYVLVLLDFTVFPANGLYVKQALDVCSNVLALSQTHAAHVQLPLVQKQTSTAAAVKHRRSVEDHFMKANVSLRDGVSLLFSKDLDATASDRRALSQSCVACMYEDFKECSFVKSAAVTEGRIGPVPLIRVSEFIGYDDLLRPGAAARVIAQSVGALRKGVPCHAAIIDAYFKGLEIEEKDRCIIFDLLPNKSVTEEGRLIESLVSVGPLASACIRLRTSQKPRRAEFARAAIDGLLTQPAPQTPKYVGVLRADQFDDINKFMRSKIFKQWDQAADAPPKQRPRSETAGPATDIQLDVLACHRGQATWPAEILQKFPTGTPEYQKLADLKAKFDKDFPSAPTQPPRDAETRASGACDYSINGGVRPVDLERTVDLESFPLDSIPEDRFLGVYWKHHRLLLECDPVSFVADVAKKCQRWDSHRVE